MRKDSLIAALIGLVAFVVYLRTLAPGITFGDSPELTTAAYQLGVPHPTGYPLYMMLGYLFMHVLPFGEPAYRMNMLSAVAGAAAVGVAYLLGLRVIRNRATSAVAALLLGVGMTFWSQAVVTEVYTLHTLLMASVLLCVLSWDRRGERRWLLGGAFLYGLAFTHHMTSLFLAPGLLYLLSTSRHRSMIWREARWLVLLFLAPLLLYIYEPLAALRDPPMNWGDPRTLSRFLEHLTGAQYRYKMGIHSWAQLGRSIHRYAGMPIEDVNPGFLLSEFGLPVIWLAPIGLWHLWRRRRRFFWATAIVYASVVAWNLNYLIGDIDAYYMLSHLMIALWIGCGLHVLLAWARRAWRRRAPTHRSRRLARGWLLGAMLALPVIIAAGNWQAEDMSHDTSALVMGRTILGFAKPGALLIGSGDDAVFPTLYPYYVQHFRNDVTILYAQDLFIHDRVRLAQRLAPRGLAINPPPGFENRKPGRQYDYSFVKKVVDDNMRDRPVYLLGMPPQTLAIMAAQGFKPNVRQVPLLLIPMLEVISDQTAAVEGKALNPHMTRMGADKHQP